MKIDLTEFLKSISFAFDYVENEFTQNALDRIAKQSLDDIAGASFSMLPHVAPFHSKRVAVLTNHMAGAMGIDDDTTYSITHAALLHDCALSQYLNLFEQDDFDIAKTLELHCAAGEKIAFDLPFYDQIRSVVLYHHERADGNGPMGKSTGDTPIGAEIIHIADDLDIRFSMDQMDETKTQKVRAFVKQQRGASYSAECADAFLETIDDELLSSITGENSLNILNSLIPKQEVELSVGALRKMATIFAIVTDYKSPFTCRHSLGIAEKASAMGHYYGYADDVCEKLYIAGALHDVGKIFIDNDILEKPGKLTSDEYRAIQNHAQGTWKLLGGISGMEDITSWAANHHEKLDGSGYPYGKTAEELGQNERLMTCLDIYQALVEERPYKSGLPHSEAMEILNKMGASGQLDTEILADLNCCFAK